MTEKMFPLNHHTVNVAASGFVSDNSDLFNGDPSTDWLSLAGWERCTWIIQKGTGATGTATVTVESAEDNTGTSNAAIPFFYRVQTSNDTWGDWTAATATGFTTTAGADQVYEITVLASDLSNLGADAWVRLVATEVANDPVHGSIIAVLTGPKTAQDTPSTVLS